MASPAANTRSVYNQYAQQPRNFTAPELQQMHRNEWLKLKGVVVTRAWTNTCITFCVTTPDVIIPERVKTLISLNGLTHKVDVIGEIRLQNASQDTATEIV